jgi:hypothetical protein
MRTKSGFEFWFVVTRSRTSCRQVVRLIVIYVPVRPPHANFHLAARYLPPFFTMIFFYRSYGLGIVLVAFSKLAFLRIARMGYLPGHVEKCRVVGCKRELKVSLLLSMLLECSCDGTRMLLESIFGSMVCLQVLPLLLIHINAIG